jgi:hypothetical protein
MSTAAVQVRIPHPRASAWVRGTVPALTLRSTAGGWALFDALGHPVFEAEGSGARLACLRRALALGVVRVRAGDEPHV